MPSVEHVEKHFTATAAVRDIVIGMSDGLTVPLRWPRDSPEPSASDRHDRCYRGIRGNCRRLDRHGPGRISGRQNGLRALCFRAQREFARRSSSPTWKPKKSRKYFAITDFRKHRWQPVVSRNHLGPKPLGGFHDAVRAWA